MTTYPPEKLTNYRWLNLFRVNWENDKNKGEWIFASRKDNQIPGPPSSDAVLIVPIHLSDKGRRLVICHEFRIPLGDYEYSFPAGLKDNNESYIECATRELKEETGLTLTKLLKVSPSIYSSTGLSDESVSMVFCECEGEVSGEGREATEDIRVHLLDLEQISKLCDSNEKQSCKLWPILLMFKLLGKIELSIT